MDAFIERVKQVCAQPEMFVIKGSYLEITALLTGYDLATNGGALVGFREWLTVRMDGGGNMTWPQQALAATFPNSPNVDPLLLTAADNRSALKMLQELLMEFCEERKRSGLRLIYLSHHAWLRRQDWYGPGCPDWFEPCDAPAAAEP